MLNFWGNAPLATPMMCYPSARWERTRLALQLDSLRFMETRAWCTNSVNLSLTSQCTARANWERAVQVFCEGSRLTKIPLVATPHPQKRHDDFPFRRVHIKRRKREYVGFVFENVGTPCNEMGNFSSAIKINRLRASRPPTWRHICTIRSWKTRRTSFCYTHWLRSTHLIQRRALIYTRSHLK